MDTSRYYIPKITVLGVGGAGCNAVNHIMDFELESINFIAANTDSQALLNSSAEEKIFLGPKTLKGLGAGSDMIAGKKAAEESISDIKKHLEGTDLLFLICGLGGGTGTGATPVIARIAKEIGILVVCIVTKPFTFEGSLRTANANKGIEEIKKETDSLIVYSNDKLLEELGEIPLNKAFNVANENIKNVVDTFTDIIISPANINLDFADVKRLLKDAKNTFFGYGIAEGNGKAIAAARLATSCKFLEASIKGSKKAIIFVLTGDKTNLIDINRAMDFIKEKSGGDVDLMFGQKMNKELKEKMIISLIAIDFDENEIKYANLENISKKTKIKELEKEKNNIFNNQDYLYKKDTENISKLDKDDENDNNDDNEDDLPPFM